MIDYLKQHQEELPTWLENYRQGDSVSFAEIMNSRIAYYPGSGFDGHLVSVANRAHCVHSYLYVDYLLKKDELISHIDGEGFRGYHSIGRIEWAERDLMPNGQYPIPAHLLEGVNPTLFVDKDVVPYCFTEVFERDADRGDEWGAERFAVTFLFADGIATYYQLFVKQYDKAPWLLLLQDHGFGCNYDRFGKGGLLDKIMETSDIRPELVICAEGTRIWDGYEKLEDLSGTRGGMHHAERFLYKKN